MNIFEDLIEELKEENLLEETVIKTKKSFEVSANKSNDETADGDTARYSSSKSEFNQPVFDTPEVKGNFSPAIEETEKKIEPPRETEFSQKFEDPDVKVSDDNQTKNFEQTITETFSKQVNEIEFFRNRANNEVLSLQMVDNVLAGVEREVLNVAPKIYDEVPVKKALHEFLQISAKTHTPEHAQAEFLLMQETESWYSALTHRDKNVKVAHLRRFCENSRPALSERALISMARFYRNAPFSESVRSKFDLILTRLFTKDIGKGRSLKISREEMMSQIGDLYADWSSIPLYSTDDDDSAIVLTEMKVEDFMSEAEKAASFEELFKSDFFNRLHIFKESTQENFFAPHVSAIVVEANVRIGNRYIELFEKQSESVEVLEEKYGLLHERIISDVVCKSLDIREIVRPETKKMPVAQTVKTLLPKPETPVEDASNPQAAIVESPDRKTRSNEKKESRGKSLFRVNKWLLVLTILTFLATAGLYFWVESVGTQDTPQGNVKNVNLENSSLKEHIQTARISGDTFYGIVTPSWDGLSREQKEEFLGKVLGVGAEKGFVKVSLINKQGKTVGFASPDRVDISNP